MDTRNYGNISLPKPIIQQIKRAIEQHPDYSSISEFVKDAVRRRLEELGIYGKNERSNSSSREGGVEG
jgi:Arc/MetJ-type ribon-helix-helix transcriptional regulator